MFGEEAPTSAQALASASALVRILHPKIEELACQAERQRIFALANTQLPQSLTYGFR